MKLVDVVIVAWGEDYQGGHTGCFGLFCGGIIGLRDLRVGVNGIFRFRLVVDWRWREVS